jgi:hypothetical protein
VFAADWQVADTASMMFPSEFLIDYVRVYQRKGQTNIGCDLKDYPTVDYIKAHPAAYLGECCVFFFWCGGWVDPNVTAWNYKWLKNGLVGFAFHVV